MVVAVKYGFGRKDVTAGSTDEDNIFKVGTIDQDCVHQLTLILVAIYSRHLLCSNAEPREGGNAAFAYATDSNKTFRQSLMGYRRIHLCLVHRFSCACGIQVPCRIALGRCHFISVWFNVLSMGVRGEYQHDDRVLNLWVVLGHNLHAENATQSKSKGCRGVCYQTDSHHSDNHQTGLP